MGRLKIKSSPIARMKARRAKEAAAAKVESPFKKRLEASLASRSGSFTLPGGGYASIGRGFKRQTTTTTAAATAPSITPPKVNQAGESQAKTGRRVFSKKPAPIKIASKAPSIAKPSSPTPAPARPPSSAGATPRTAGGGMGRDIAKTAVLAGAVSAGAVSASRQARGMMGRIKARSAQRAAAAHPSLPSGRVSPQVSAGKIPLRLGPGSTLLMPAGTSKPKPPTINVPAKSRPLNIKQGKKPPVKEAAANVVKGATASVVKTLNKSKAPTAATPSPVSMSGRSKKLETPTPKPAAPASPSKKAGRTMKLGEAPAKAATVTATKAGRTMKLGGQTPEAEKPAAPTPPKVEQKAANVDKAAQLKREIEKQRTINQRLKALDSVEVIHKKTAKPQESVPKVVKPSMPAAKDKTVAPAAKTTKAPTKTTLSPKAAAAARARAATFDAEPVSVERAAKAPTKTAPSPVVPQSKAQKALAKQAKATGVSVVEMQKLLNDDLGMPLAKQVAREAGVDVKEILNAPTKETKAPAKAAAKAAAVSEKTVEKVTKGAAKSSQGKTPKAPKTGAKPAPLPTDTPRVKPKPSTPASLSEHQSALSVKTSAAERAARQAQIEAHIRKEGATITDPKTGQPKKVTGPEARAMKEAAQAAKKPGLGTRTAPRVDETGDLLKELTTKTVRSSILRKAGKAVGGPAAIAAGALLGASEARAAGATAQEQTKRAGKGALEAGAGAAVVAGIAKLAPRLASRVFAPAAVVQTAIDVARAGGAGAGAFKAWRHARKTKEASRRFQERKRKEMAASARPGGGRS